MKNNQYNRELRQFTRICKKKWTMVFPPTQIAICQEANGKILSNKWILWDVYKNVKKSFRRQKGKKCGLELWTVWITRCITAFYSRKRIRSSGQLSTISLWITVDKVDKSKIECMICAICLVYDNIEVYVAIFGDETGSRSKHVYPMWKLIQKADIPYRYEVTEKVWFLKN